MTSAWSRGPAVLIVLAALLHPAKGHVRASDLQADSCPDSPLPANWIAEDDHGRTIAFPARGGLPVQERPLVVMTYNIAGHDARFRSTHIEQIVAAINQVRPDIVGLEEVHRGTWLSRHHDQMEELEKGTGMHGFFGASFRQGDGEFGNAILTRGEILSAKVHPLPGAGEPRTLIESVLRIDGATINFYVTHLTAWERLHASVRGRQLACVEKWVRASGYPFLLAGDFNAAPGTAEVRAFESQNVAQMCGGILPVTVPLMRERIDYVWADYGWKVLRTSVPHLGPSDHWPVVTELLWN